MGSIKYTIDAAKLCRVTHTVLKLSLGGWVRERGIMDHIGHIKSSGGPYHCENLTLGPCTDIKRGQSEVTN